MTASHLSLLTCHKHFLWLEVGVADRVQKALPFCLANAVLHRSLRERSVRESLEGGVLVLILHKQISVRCLPDVYDYNKSQMSSRYLADVYDNDKNQMSSRRLPGT